MTLALYFDHQVHVAISNGLSQRGIDVVTAFEDGCAQLADEDLLVRVTELGRILFTQDDDFPSIAQDWLTAEREFSGIVYSHQLSITVGKAIADLELIAHVMTPEEMRNRLVFIPL